jgi:hypothetical protein
MKPLVVGMVAAFLFAASPAAADGPAVMVIYAMAQSQASGTPGVAMTTAGFASMAACNAALGVVQIETGNIKTTAVCVPSQ